MTPLLKITMESYLQSLQRAVGPTKERVGGHVSPDMYILHACLCGVPQAIFEESEIRKLQENFRDYL